MDSPKSGKGNRRERRRALQRDNAGPHIEEESVAQMGNGKFKFSLKDLLVIVAATALALGSIKAEDPWVVIPMLALSGIAFMGLCIGHEGRWQTRSAIGAVLVILLVFIGWRDLHKTIVEISPSEVIFRQTAINGASGIIPNAFSQQYTFRITNTTDQDVYAIGAELKIKSDRLSVNDFNLDIPKASWKSLNESDPGNSQTGDMMVIGIHNKQTNLSCFVVEITHLEPHESREIAIWESDTKDGNEDTATVTGSIYHFSLEPDPVLRNAKGGMFLPNIPLPESGLVEKIVILHLPKA